MPSSSLSSNETRYQHEVNPIMGAIPSDSERSLGFPLWSVSLCCDLISYWIGWSCLPIKSQPPCRGGRAELMIVHWWPRVDYHILFLLCNAAYGVKVLKYSREVFKRDELLDVGYGWCSRCSVDDKVKHRIYSYSPLYLRYNPPHRLASCSALLCISQQHKSDKIVYCLLVE